VLLVRETGRRYRVRQRIAERGRNRGSFELEERSRIKILKGQGSAAPLGKMDFVVKGVMIGGFALVAAPPEYGVTGVRTFTVSHDGVVYDKDFAAKTLDEFQKMERFNRDNSWTPVAEDNE
jgi:Protein of unknown function (DUF2950)